MSAGDAAIRKRTTKYASPCKIVDNIVIGEEVPIYRECIGIGELLYEKLDSRPDFVGQIDTVTEKRRTFAEIKERSVKCALWLKKQNIQIGDVVAVCTHNHLDSIIPLLGCLYIGALFYPMHFRLDIHDARYFISLAKPKIIFVNADMAKIMAQATVDEKVTAEIITFDVDPKYQSFQQVIENQEVKEIDRFRCTPIVNLDQIGIIICSSGSTGPCKAVMLSHSALINHMLHDDSFAAKDEEIVMWFSSFRWISGTLLPLQSIYFYKTSIICSQYNEEMTCKLIETYNVAWILLQTALTVCVLKDGLFHKYRLPSLRKLIIGGAYMRPLLHEAVITALPHTKVLYTYGMCEIGGVCTVQRQGDKIGSCGYVFKNEQLKVIATDTSKVLGPNEIGELLWKSPYTMTKYYNNPQATEEVLDKDGWIHSGDIGYYDEDGEIYITDRIKELIQIRGCYVYPNEIESVLQSHSAVREVAVVRIPSDIDDEHPMAFVTKVSGKEVTAEELVKLVADNLEDYKHLRGGVQFLNKIPHTDTGKIARKQLREMAKYFARDCVMKEYMK